MTYLRLHIKTLLTMLSLLLIAVVAGCTKHGDEGAQGFSKPPGKSDNVYAASTDSLELLLPIIENGLYGFVTESGHVKIAPRFRAVGMFSEGLAPVRETGRYGYIDRSGAWAIAPRYDYATPFSEGHAVGFIDSLAYLLDAKGGALYIGVFDGASRFCNGLAIVRRHFDSALIDGHGFVIVHSRDTRFVVLDGTHILTRPIIKGPEGYMIPSGQTQLIDQHGTVLRSYTGFGGYVSTYGSPVFLLWKGVDIDSISSYHIFNIRGDYVAKVSERIVDNVESLQRTGYFSIHKNLMRNGWTHVISHVLDPSGRVALWDNEHSIALFGRSLAVSNNLKTKELRVFDLADNMRLVHRKTVRNYNALNAGDYQFNYPDWPDVFYSTRDYAIIETANGRVVMDDGGNCSAALLLPLRSEILYSDSSRIIAMYNDWKKGKRTLYFFDLNGESVPRARFENVEQIRSVTHGVVSARIGHSLMYINRNGMVIWKSNEAMMQKQQTDFDYKPEVWHSGEEDSARSITPGGMGAELRRHGLFLRDDASTPVQIFAFSMLRNKGLTMQVVVANTSSDTVEMNSSDGRITLVMEARRKPNDAWQEIEYLPQSWCGNSASVSSLPNNSYWRFTATHYTGGDTVECRMKLDLDKEYAWTRIKRNYPSTIYSNAFTLSINPAQLWRINPHRATGLMDHY